MTQEDKVEFLLKQGHQQLERGQEEAALATFQQAAAREPDNPQVLYELALACLRLERYQESAGYLKKALQVNPSYLLALTQRGLADQEFNDNEQARADFELTISIEPQDYENWQDRVILLDELELHEEAIAFYDKAIEINPDDHYAWDNKGNALYDLGRYEEALASYDKVIEINPDYEQVYINRGALLCDCMGRYEEAISSFDKAIEIKPDFHEAWNNRGVALKNLGRYEEAIASFDKAIEIKPDFHEEWESRGMALYNLGRYEEALASHDKAIKIKPDFHKSWESRGMALYNLGRYEEALASHDKAIKIKPDYHEAWYNKGMALYNLGRYEEALASHDKAIKIKPDHHEAWYHRGIALYNLGRYEEVLASHDKAIKIKPDYHEAWNNKAMALKDLGRYEEALASYDKAIEIKHDDYIPWNNRGIALKDLGRYEEAIASYDEALRLTNNQNWKIWDNRGVAVFKSRGYEAAIQNWNDGILALQPQTPHYQQGVGELHCKKASYQYQYGKEQPSNLSNPLSFWFKAKLSGELHRQKASYQYQYGKEQPSNPFSFWFEAKLSYEAALNFLSFKEFPQRHLEVLQEYLIVCNALGDSQTIQERLEKGTQQLEELLRQCDVFGQKIFLSHKFVAFDQLRVDAKAESSDKQQQIQALELAERRKNTCLSWYQYGWEREVPKTTYQEMQQLLNRKTAIIYWHLSPAAITTFILRHEKPLVVQTLKPLSSPQKPQTTSPETANLKAAQQLEAFEKWMKIWQQDYENYGQASPEEKKTHPWRVQMHGPLSLLAEILDINAILSHLQGIERLILIPHRQLHLLPLHYLFNVVAQQQFAISYLPSARIGIDLKRQATSQANYLLNVEQAKNLTFIIALSAVISQLFPYCQNLRETDLTPAQLMAALSTSKGIFHFGGHGKHNIDQPLKSALLLTKEQELTLGDIFKIELGNYYLVCLCACETGITSQQNLIDEYVGLVSGFVRRGVTHVLSSLWTVREDATTLLLIRFYQFLKLGVAPVLALQQAQEWLRSVTNSDLAQWYRDLADEFSGPKGIKRIINGEAKKFAKMDGSEYPYAHPYYWAAYFLTGIER